MDGEAVHCCEHRLLATCKLPQKWACFGGNIWNLLLRVWKRGITAPFSRFFSISFLSSQRTNQCTVQSQCQHLIDPQPLPTLLANDPMTKLVAQIP